MPDPCVFLALPTYGPFDLAGQAGRTHPAEEVEVVTAYRQHSLLAHNFNCLWCHALNARAAFGLTHFAMVHADVNAPPLWLDELVAEQARVGADLLSAVLPIKDGRGLTTTGWQHPASGAVTRFSMTEVMTFPETFDARDAGLPEGAIFLVNTGLWVCDFTQSWVEEFSFEIRDRIVKKPDGLFQATVLSEDWNMSRWLAVRGLKVMVTRTVPLGHVGRWEFRNDHAWGDWTQDESVPDQSVFIEAVP
jgi:hypothetical protein